MAGSLNSSLDGPKDFCGRPFSLESTVRIEEFTHAVDMQTLGFSFEVAQAGGTLRCHDQNSREVPRRRQSLVAVEQLLCLELPANLALLGLEVANGVRGVNTRDFNGEAVLRLENWFGQNEQLDARCELSASGALELRNDAFSGRSGWTPAMPGARRRIELISADHQNKPDVASQMVRSWIDTQGVDMIVDANNSAVALAVAKIVTEKKRIFIAGGVGTTRLTNEDCSPYVVQYIFDTYASGDIDFAGSLRGIVHGLLDDAETAVGAINRGIAAIGVLIAGSSPEIEDGTIHQETIEALGWLLSELGELGGACVVLAARCRRVHPPDDAKENLLS
jgi:hypothetical protein